MSIKEQLTFVAALAVALASAALWPVYDGGTWVLRTLGAIGVVMVAGLLARRAAVPRPLQPLATLLGLAAYVVLVFGGTTLRGGLLPTQATLDLLTELARQGNADINEYGPPVPVSTGIVLLTVLGVGGIAVVVDLVAVVLDRAALAGLPLLVLFVVPSAVLPGGLSAQYFVLGAFGWLALLMVEGSERVGRWGTPLRAAAPRGGYTDDSSLGRVGRRIGFAAVGAGILVPLLVPGMDARLLGGDGEGAGGSGSNSAKTYNPITRLSTQLRLPSPVELFQYTTSDPDPDYVRMTTLDTFSFDGWSASALSASQKDAKVQDGIDAPVGDSAVRRDFTMRVALTDGNLDVRWLPVPFGPRKVDVKGLWLWDADSQTVFSAQRSTKGLGPYDVVASRALPDQDALDAGGTVPAEIAETYAAPVKVDPYVQTLTAQVVRRATTSYDKAVALQRFFTDRSSGFRYSLNASLPGRGQDPLVAFLTGKRGFCEQYATAMAAMLRVAGVPSRVAVGFTRGTLVDGTSDVYSVTTNQAHAWPEAWFPGVGWVRFEPTPAASGATTPAYTVPRVQAPVTPLPSQAPAPAPTGSASPNAPGPTERPDIGAGLPGASDDTGGPSRWLLVPVVLAVLLVLPFLLTVLRRRRRWRTPGPLTAWSQLQDDAVDVGHRWHPADSPRAAAARLLAERPLPTAAADALRAVAQAAEVARYAPADRPVRAGLHADVDTVRAALQHGAPTWVRARARFAPPSTLRWVAHGTGERIADALDALDDVISAVTRPVRRRASAR